MIIDTTQNQIREIPREGRQQPVPQRTSTSSTLSQHPQYSTIISQYQQQQQPQQYSQTERAAVATIPEVGSYDTTNNTPTKSRMLDPSIFSGQVLERTSSTIITGSIAVTTAKATDNPSSSSSALIQEIVHTQQPAKKIKQNQKRVSRFKQQRMDQQ